MGFSLLVFKLSEMSRFLVSICNRVRQLLSAVAAISKVGLYGGTLSYVHKDSDYKMWKRFKFDIRTCKLISTPYSSDC